MWCIYFEENKELFLFSNKYKDFVHLPLLLVCKYTLKIIARLIQLFCNVNLFSI